MEELNEYTVIDPTISMITLEPVIEPLKPIIDPIKPIKPIRPIFNERPVKEKTMILSSILTEEKSSSPRASSFCGNNSLLSSSIPKYSNRILPLESNFKVYWIVLAKNNKNYFIGPFNTEYEATMHQFNVGGKNSIYTTTETNIGKVNTEYSQLHEMEE